MPTGDQYKFSFLQIIAGFLFVVFFDSTIKAQFPKVEIPNTQLRKITSAITHDNYLVYVHLPNNYETKKKNYPIVYLLDGHWLFPLVTGLYNNEYGDAAIPEMIIVGITWDVKDPNMDSLRQSNYSPVKVKDLPGSGNASNFLLFIKQELIPFAEQNYRVEKGNRTIMGGSLGGLFVGYALLQDNKLFNRYIMASPAFDWDNGIIFQLEKKRFEKSSSMDAKVFIAGGADDYGINDITKFCAQLKSRNYKDLYLKTTVLQDLGHSGTTSIGFNQGLKDLFTKSSTKLDTATLNRYAGTYTRKPGDDFRLFRDGTDLKMQYSDKIVFKLCAENTVNFFIKGVYILFQFTVSADKISGVNIDYGTGEGYYKKIN